MNTFKTVFLMMVLTGIFLLAGYWIGGDNGMIFALVLATAVNFVSYWYSDKIVLRMYRAQPIDQASNPGLYRMVAELCQRAQLPMPKLYAIPDPAANAFATGRDPQHAVVAVTDGIVRMLDESELQGVIAHELSHVKNRDMLIATLAATMAGALMIMARIGLIFGGVGDRDRRGGGLVMLIVAPLAALLIQMAVSRSREYQADASGAQLSQNPMGLASALQKLQAGARSVPLQAQPATSHLFIVNPLTGKSLTSLFSTHPPIEKRIERLRTMTG